MIRPAAALAAVLVLAACSRPPAPDTDRPVEPKSAQRPGDVRRTIDAPLDRTRAAAEVARTDGKAAGHGGAAG